MHYQSPPPSGGDVATEPAPTGCPTDKLDSKLTTLDRELRQDGWKTATTAGTDTKVITQDDARDVLLVHEAPNTRTATANKVFQNGGLISKCTYRQRRNDRLYELLLFLNPGTEHALLLPTIINTDHLPATDEVTALYSVVTHATGDRIGVVQHTTPSTMLPDST